MLKESMKASDSPYRHQEWIKTGIPALDVAIGKGIPRGRITELSGSESSGKTSLALWIIRHAQKHGLRCYFVDAEHSLDFELAEKMGIDLEKLDLIEGSWGEEYLDKIEEVIPKADVIVVDSVAALQPRDMVEADSAKQFIGLHARMLSRFLPRIIFPLIKNKTALIIINQVRMDMFSSFPTTTGGRSLKHYKSVQIMLKATDKIKSGENVVGIRVAGNVRKNKVGAPFREFSSNLLFGEGFDGSLDVLEHAEGLGVITRKGNTLWFGETKLGTKNKARSFLGENPDVLEEIKKACE